jgi:predicted transcriptional regulator
VISEAHGTSANIDSIASCDIETGTQIYLVLDDGAAFRIAVEAVFS